MNNLSYEKYLCGQLQLFAPQIQVKTYKTANKVDYPIFERHKDLRIQFHNNKKCIFEFIIEKSFWYLSKMNKDDKKYMRLWADYKLNMIRDAINISCKKDND